MPPTRAMEVAANAPVPFRADADGRVRWLGAGWERLGGAAVDWLDAAEDRPALEAAWRAALRDGAPFTAGCRLRRSGGASLAVRVHAEAEIGPDGRVLAWHGSIAAAEAPGDARWRQVLDLSPLSVAIVRGVGVLYANPAYVRLFGGEDAAAMVGGDLLAHIAPEQRPLVAERARRRAAGLPEPTSYTVTGLRRDGVRLPLHVEVAPIVLADGPASLVFLTDISAHVDAERALHDSERRFAAFMEAAPFLAFIKDADGRFVWSNRQHQRYVGGQATVIGRTAAEVFGADAAPVVEIDRRILADGCPVEYEVELPCADGVRRAFLATKFLLPAADGRPLIGSIAVDISERRRLRELHQRLSAILEATSDFVGTATPDGRVVYINSAGRRMCGVPLEADVESMRVDDFQPAWALAQMREQAFPAALAGRAWTGESAFLDRSGREIPVSQVVIAHRGEDGSPWLSTVARDITAAKAAEAALREREAQLQAAFDTIPIQLVIVDREGRVVRQNASSIASWGDHVGSRPTPSTMGEAAGAWDEHVRRALAGDSIDDELTITLADGRQRILHVMVAPIVAGGAVAGAIAAALDLSEQRRLEDQLRQAQKMEAVGRLAGGIAHDFNNLLTAILGFAGLLAERHPPGDPSRPAIDQVQRAGERAADLTGKLLAFARKQVVALRPVDVAAVVGELASLLRRLIGEHIALELVLPDGLWPAKADPAQLGQVVMNLVVNARDAMPRGGRIVVAAANRAVDAGGDAEAGDWVELSVTDTGAGIAPEVREHLFEPFWTTKQASGGTGLGLSTVYGIVTQSGGRIAVDSRNGQGTRFTVLWPRSVEPAQPVPMERPRLPRGGGETILVVEDEPQVRDLVAATLAAEGYAVLVEGDPRAAAALIGGGRRIDLLLSDVIMPGMSGPELAARVAAHQPRARALLMSGYPGDEIDVGTGTGTAFLAKPFTAHDLLARVRAVLDGR